MKTLEPRTSGLARIGAVVATLGLAVVGAFATPTVQLNVGGKDKNGDDYEFGKGIELHASSGTWVLSKSKGYSYKLVGTCTGTGALATAFPAGTPISTFLNYLKPGSGSTLSGSYSNPSGQLDFEVLHKTYTGNKTLPGLGAVTLSATIIAGTKLSGEVYLDVTDVDFTSTNPTPLGTIKFDKGAKFIINTAPQVQFFTKVPFGNENSPSGTIDVVVTRYGNLKGVAKVHYETSDGTASSVLNKDFTAQNGNVTFNSKDTEETISIPITNNAIHDKNRKFTITLTPLAINGAVLGPKSVATVTIVDDD
ncbi:MAG: Calx-beta domain-containing protein [Luteolibacter sp.]|uniref:Calx-beta domain-containing protein n=1 Tax=Luteolibacter sp. TaxID=1962973 RepID=UPI003262FFFC